MEKRGRVKRNGEEERGVKRRGEERRRKEDEKKAAVGTVAGRLSFLFVGKVAKEI